MMIGHLTFAGLAGIDCYGWSVSYLQGADPSLLRLTARMSPIATCARRAKRALARRPRAYGWFWRSFSSSLLGIVTAGSAWGEWSAKDFENCATRRREMAAASRNQAPPAQAPKGLQRLSSLRDRPISGYAPAFLENAYFGYFASAMRASDHYSAGSALERIFGAVPDPKRQRAMFLKKPSVRFHPRNTACDFRGGPGAIRWFP